jgi:FAD/FMN-containing dehydrogenase
MSIHAITRHEHRLVRRHTQLTNSAEAEATIAADYDAAIADEAIDKSALEAMALVKAEHGTKEAEKDAEANKKKNEKLLLLKEQLLEDERTDRPRRCATSTLTAMLA